MLIISSFHILSWLTSLLTVSSHFPEGLTILDNGTLFVSNTTMEDSGVYICIARNDAGTAFGQIRLTVAGI